MAICEFYRDGFAKMTVDKSFVEDSNFQAGGDDYSPETKYYLKQNFETDDQRANRFLGWINKVVG